MVAYRPIRPEDCQFINRWIEADPWHKDTPGMLDFFMAKGCAILSDFQGPVMVVRFDENLEAKRVTIHIQFGTVSRLRIAKVLLEGFRSILRAFKDFGFVEAVFTSINPSLIGFCKKLGFEPRNGVYSYLLQDQSPASKPSEDLSCVKS